MAHGFKKVAQRAEYQIARVIKALSMVGAAGILVMMLLTTTDVAGRYLLNKPVLFAYEVTEYLMVVCVYMALAYTESQDGHVNVTALYSHLSPRVQAIMFIAARVVILALCILLIGKTFSLAYFSLQQNEITPTGVGTPLGPAKMVVPIGLSLMVVELILRIVSRIRMLWLGAAVAESVEIPKKMMV